MFTQGGARQYEFTVHLSKAPVHVFMYSPTQHFRIRGCSGFTASDPIAPTSYGLCPASGQMWPLSAVVTVNAESVFAVPAAGNKTLRDAFCQ